ncbi:MAG TPA: S53 family peptidase [Acidobacteriaceae bacterium]|jgi:subtilase family serine protease|nr:S53 family peptidase [Acidobacteriaceae bacterium]
MKPSSPFAVALLAAAVATAPAFAQTTWVSTATHGISLSQLASAADYGPARTDQTLTVRLALKLQNQAALTAFIRNVNNPTNPLYGQFLTPAQFAGAYAPGNAQTQQVVSYLQSQGFENVTVEPNNLLISADGTVAQASAAFNTPIEQFAQFGNIVYGNTAPAQVPAALGNIVGAVLGLNTIGQMKPTLVTRAQVSVPQYAVSYDPQQFQEIYSATGTPTGSNATIAIMAEGDLTQVLKDLRTEEAAFRMPQVVYTVVPVGIASSDTSGEDEWDLDTQYSTGMAQTVKRLYIYDTTSLTDSDLALEFSRWATDDKAKAGSASLGECEIFPYLDGSMLADDEVFAEAAAQGQSFFASTGDTGSFCPAEVGENGVPAGVPMVNYPAASQYVMGVGGTTLLTNSDGTYDTEIAWYAGGGGISQFEYSPYWQTAAAVPSSELGEKGIPDIAMDADPYSGANVYVDGAVEAVGGTSLSSPLALGVWARLISANPKLGFAPVRYYGLYDGVTTPGSYPDGGFHDITVGANGFYAALPGWDYTTGLGTLWVDQLAADLKK